MIRGVDTERKGERLMTKRLAALVFLAAVAAPAAPAAAANGDLPVPVQQYEGISYYSAGVTIEERAALPQRFPLKIVFATNGGHLLCGADVTIKQGGKTVFRGSADNGPWLIVDVPPGTYDIEAVQDGTKKSARGVTVAPGGRRAVLLRWRTTEVNMGLEGAGTL